MKFADFERDEVKKRRNSCAYFEAFSQSRSQNLEISTKRLFGNRSIALSCFIFEKAEILLQ